MAALARHRWLAVAALGVVVLAGAVVGAAYAYDATRPATIAEGIRAGGVDLGGLKPEQARQRLAHAYRRLEKPIAFHRGGTWFVLKPRDVDLTVHVDETVAAALDRSQSGWFLPRAVRELTGSKVKASLAPRITYSEAAVEKFVAKIERQTDRPARDATLTPSADRLAVAGGSEGAALAEQWLRGELRRALVTPTAPRRYRLPVRRLEPKTTIPKLKRKYPSYITIDRGNFTLRVYERLKLARTYSIAVGQVGLETPAGVYEIQDKQVNPAWHVPNSDWAGDLAGKVVPPGPDDPLKARWMGIFNGAGIHGTDDTSSIGHAVSHGCVRMTVPDVIDLYDRVDVGTPVYIG